MVVLRNSKNLQNIFLIWNVEIWNFLSKAGGDYSFEHILHQSNVTICRGLSVEAECLSGGLNRSSNVCHKKKNIQKVSCEENVATRGEREREFIWVWRIWTWTLMDSGWMKSEKSIFAREKMWDFYWHSTSSQATVLVAMVNTLSAVARSGFLSPACLIWWSYKLKYWNSNPVSVKEMAQLSLLSWSGNHSWPFLENAVDLIPTDHVVWNCTNLWERAQHQCPSFSVFSSY